MNSSDDEPEIAPIPVPAPVPVRDRSATKPREQRTFVPKDLIEGYLLEEWLGEGAMGAVFRARQLSLDRAVAVKILTPRLAQNDAYLKRFLREARSVARLNHPNVVSGIDVGESRGHHYFVMEYVEGKTLQQILDETPRLDPVKCGKVILQIAKALEHADQAGLVHRDVKPANIILSSKSGSVKLCDLGLAKEVQEDSGAQTGEGRAAGTPYYISPEQASGRGDVDIRSDLYSLGATYYHCVCGQPPFSGQTPAVIMAKHLTEPLRPVRQLRPDCPKGIAHVIETCLRKERDERYDSPEELIEELTAVLEGRWKEAPAVPRLRRRRRFR
jgi:serine/threonine-protein kinase